MSELDASYDPLFDCDDYHDYDGLLSGDEAAISTRPMAGNRSILEVIRDYRNRNKIPINEVWVPFWLDPTDSCFYPAHIGNCDTFDDDCRIDLTIDKCYAGYGFSSESKFFSLKLTVKVDGIDQDASTPVIRTFYGREGNATSLGHGGRLFSNVPVSNGYFEFTPVITPHASPETKRILNQLGKDSVPVDCLSNYIPGVKPAAKIANYLFSEILTAFEEKTVCDGPVGLTQTEAKGTPKLRLGTYLLVMTKIEGLDKVVYFRDGIPTIDSDGKEPFTGSYLMISLHRAKTK